LVNLRVELPAVCGEQIDNTRIDTPQLAVGLFAQNYQIVQIAIKQNPEISKNHNTLSLTAPSATRAMSKPEKHAMILAIILCPRFILSLS